MNIEKQYELKQLSSLGVPLEELAKYDVLVLPENYRGDFAAMIDAQDAITLSKMLKGEGIKCANSLDLGLEIPTVERRANDMWLGAIYILNEAVIPFAVSIIANLVTPMIQHRLSKKDERTPTGVIHTEITVQKVDSYANIKYTGDAETFIKILDTLKGGDTHEITGE